MHRDVCGEGSGGKMSPLPSTRPSTPPSPAVAEASSAPGSSIGVNLRVTGHCSQGGRKYMEDFFSVAYHQSENAKDLEYAFVGIYDGHGGSEAATFAKEHLMMEIINQKLFWSNSDQDVLRAIREGYIATHYAMWREQEKWPKTATGLPSTAGTTATVAFIRREKIYIGHVGDSGIVLGYQNPDESFWRAKQLTQDHKPESPNEKARIANAGGKVMVKSGVPRVVWNRPRTGHKGPVRRSTPIDEIPFLAVARSLGDLWSYNSALNEFVVSPDPDVKVIKINPKTFRCLIFGTDGLWNVISPADAVDTVHEKEIINERMNKMRVETSTSWCNPSKGLVDKALRTWSSKKMRADNTSVVTVILYPPGANTTKYSLTDESMSSIGLEYMHMNTELHPRENYVHILSHSNQQKILPSFYETERQLYDMDSFNNSHQLPHYETIAPSSAMRLHLQQQQSHQDGYMSSYLDRDDNVYTNNYETNCDNRYFYYDDQTSSSFTNSFAESYNSLLTSSLEREEKVCSSKSVPPVGSNCNDDESVIYNPNDYHSYHSLHHTGLAGHDRVQHHYPNNEYEMEQLLYQEQCMSAEEGYSLTKLETRGEQQLRGSGDNSLNCVQSFQIFDDGRSFVADNSGYNQYNSISSSYQDDYSSSYLNQYESESNCYESNMDVSLMEDLTVPSGTTTSLCIERLDASEVERLAAEEAIETDSIAPKAIMNIEMEKSEEEVNENLDEMIQIHEISSSVIDETPSLQLSEPRQPPEPPEPFAETIPIEQNLQPVFCEAVIDSTPFKKHSIPKLVLYPNVPNENHRNSRRTSMQQYPRNFEKRMLRSMTVDYSKRTLRSRNSLSKDLKVKSTLNSNSRRSAVVQNKFMKAMASSANAENSSVISRKCLNLRSRQITASASLWPSAVSSASTSSTTSSTTQKLLKTKPLFYENSTSSRTLPSSRLKNNSGGSSSSSPLMIRAVSSRMSAGNSQINHSQQITVSFAKKTSLRNSSWSSVKSTIQTRNRVQKRLNR